MEADIIVGRALDGGPLVLLESFVSSAQIASAVTQHWVVNSAYVGTDTAPTECSNINVRLQGLNAFTGRSGLTVAGGAASRDRVDVTWEPQDPLVTFAVDGWRLEIIDERTLELYEDQFSVAHLERVRLVPPNPVPWDAATKQAGLAAGLLEFFADRPMSVERQWEELASGASIVHLFRPLVGHPPRDPERTWLKLRDVGSNLENALGAWVQLNAEQQPLVSLVLEEVRLRRASDAVTRILRLTQVLELLHRHRHPSARPEDDDEVQKTQTVLEATPEDLQGWLADRLGVSRIRLRQRIRETLEEDLQGSIDTVCGGRDAFAATATKTRNWHTHYGSESGVAQGLDASILAQRLWFTVRAALLIALGWTSGEAASLLVKDSGAAWLTGRPQVGN